MRQESRCINMDPTRGLITLESVELFRCLRVALRILSPDRKVHSVSPADITPDHPLVTDVLPDFSPQFGFNLEVL